VILSKPVIRGGHSSKTPSYYRRKLELDNTTDDLAEREGLFTQPKVKIINLNKETTG